MPKWIAIIFFSFIAIILLPWILQWWHDLLVIATEDLPQQLKVLVLFAFDPLEYIWKWFIALVAGIVVVKTRA